MPVGMGSEIPPDELKFITAATGGRLWVGQTPRDLNAAVVNFFQRLARPQEAPITGSDSAWTSGSGRQW